jgi:hypothetical protein
MRGVWDTFCAAGNALCPKISSLIVHNSPISEISINDYYVSSSTVLSIQAILVAGRSISTALLEVHWATYLGLCVAGRGKRKRMYPRSTNGNDSSAMTVADKAGIAIGTPLNGRTACATRAEYDILP